MAFDQFNLITNQRAERRLLITVAEWLNDDQIEREILGTRVEESSIEYNPDIDEGTDILGFNYADINKTQPQQDFDSYLILGGSKLGAKLNDIRQRDAVNELNQFSIYIITVFTGIVGSYPTEKHSNCTITYNSLGGSDSVEFPISVYFSNNIELGFVDKLADDFEFTDTPDVADTEWIAVEIRNGYLCYDQLYPKVYAPLINFDLVNGDLVYTNLDSNVPIDFDVLYDDLIMEIDI